MREKGGLRWPSFDLTSVGPLGPMCLPLKDSRPLFSYAFLSTQVRMHLKAPTFSLFPHKNSCLLGVLRPSSPGSVRDMVFDLVGTLIYLQNIKYILLCPSSIPSPDLCPQDFRISHSISELISLLFHSALLLKLVGLGFQNLIWASRLIGVQKDMKSSVCICFSVHFSFKISIFEYVLSCIY